jgi:hypothetical protein
MVVHPYETCAQPCLYNIPGLRGERKELTLEVARNADAKYSGRQRQHNLVSFPNRNAGIYIST